ncbi:MAG: class I SAM-dependent methyltransferase [Rhodanobacter sp.]|nr:MAG: class I SAM-dependent methyltransferase [Rhodanobacter sp.]TAL90666.1 MAG: class I SAM-dependent methyltransferase [Rhodanobacter sp.]TAM43274.1 MAG: class I SAM-dependent methyltransferase [Rhodanobacter sp.]
MNPAAYLEMANTESAHWWFAARRDILNHLIGKFGLPASARILEAGSGTGGNLAMLAAHGEVSAIEMDEVACRIASENTGGRFDLRRGCFPDDIPFKGETFDLIGMFDVLEHVEQDVETLRALRGLLAPGGRMLITVPAYQWMWSAHDVFLHHKRRYTAKSLRKALADAGLRVERVSYFNMWLLPLAMLARLKDRMTPGARSPGSAVPSAFVNRVLFSIFRSERHLLDGFALPAGVSLLAVARCDHA